MEAYDKNNSWKMQVLGEPNVTFLYENIFTQNLQAYRLTKVMMLVFCIRYDT